MNPQGLQFPLGFPQAQQQSFDSGSIQPNLVSAQAAQMDMPAFGDSNNNTMGTQIQNATQMLQVSLAQHGI